MPRNRCKPGDGKNAQSKAVGNAHRSGSACRGGRRGNKIKGKDFIDAAVIDLVLSIGEHDNTNQSRKSYFHEQLLVHFLQANVEKMYPSIGQKTYRVPFVHINKGKEKETNEEGVYEYVPSQETDCRSDRAHSFVSDMIFHLSQHMKGTNIGPFFIISSYEYDHFLSRLKKFFEEKPGAVEVEGINFPKGSGHDRGEIDIIIVLPKHVIFVEIKAIGDNFNEFEEDKEKITKTNIEKAILQLVRDEKVFNHVMEDLQLQDFKRTKIAALPNLERLYLETAMKDEELKKKCEPYKFLCKDEMPRDRQNYKDFHIFLTWWIDNVFPEYKPPEKSLGIGNDKPVAIDVPTRTPLDEVKIIVGRYVGFMSVVTVCNNSNSPRLEVRRKGQSAWYVGNRFSKIVLTNDQKRYLDENIKLGYLCGPPGSGKTVVLVVKARRWILNEGKYVVIVNMYRGANGRAIGKQIYKTVTGVDKGDQKQVLKDHCMEIGVDVDAFNDKKFLETIRSRWGQEIGAQGEQMMFIVDETYVQSYWDNIFSTLRGNFPESGMWCAGLYGKQPLGFTSMELKQVIRCPSTVQNILALIDWDENRKLCYTTIDSAKANLPTDGLPVLTIHHKEHVDYVNESPSQCPKCGAELARLFEEDLQVEKPGAKDKDPDLRLCSLKCSDIVFLVNIPRSAYTPDEAKHLDTTEEKYRECMKGFENCPMLEILKKAGYPYRVHTQLSCPDLISSNAKQLINVTWIYTYQGLENKVIIFIPGNERMPEDQSNVPDLTDPFLNIPCPGLRRDKNKENQISDEDSESDGHSSEGGREDSESDGHSSEESREDLEGSHELTLQTSFESRGTPSPVSSSSCTCLSKQNDLLSMCSSSCLLFDTSDLDSYTRWDKNNLFISASRCTSQLVLITR